MQKYLLFPLTKKMMSKTLSIKIGNIRQICDQFQFGEFLK